MCREGWKVMKEKKCSRRLVMYEIRNIIGNPFTTFFGIVFPVLMLLIITNALDVPGSMKQEVNTSVFITLSLIVPMAVVLLGYAANYSQELEKEIPVRMQLFGFRERSLMLARVIAQIVAMTVGLVLYTGLSLMLVDIAPPTISAVLSLIVCLYLLGVLFFLFAHGIANIFRKFGPTYAVCMFFYFGAMILCGMMGIQTDQLPKAMQYVAKLLPMSYISSDFIDFWKGGQYNFGPMIQSFLFFGAVCGILMVYAGYRNRRIIK